MESFWATLETELVEEQPFASHAAVRCDILLYIEGFYCPTSLRARNYVDRPQRIIRCCAITES
jgi:hypothetical protein